MGTASAVSRRAWRRSSAPKWGRREGPAGEWRDQGVTQQGVTRLGSLHEECSAAGQVDQEGAGVGVLDPGRTDLARTVGPGPDADQDRKSTRLNSSHVAISYAVFCLKQKHNYARR